MSDVTLFDAALPAQQQLEESLRRLGDERAAGGVAFMKMNKQGRFTWGIDKVEVAEDERWAINPASIMVGYIGWKGGQVVGEEMLPLTSNRRIDPNELDPIVSSKQQDGWKEQITIMLRHMETGDSVIFKTSSRGGMSAISDLAREMAAQVKENPHRPVPVVCLKADSYIHREYGEIFTPVFEVVDWVDMDGKKPRRKPAAKEEDKPALV